jgi:hypothetical protein
MTLQSGDRITYYEKEYELETYPLYQYLEKRDDIFFNEYSSAEYRGYLAHWSIYKSKLILNEIKSNNHDLKSIFNTEDPVEASWFNGKLSICIKEDSFPHTVLRYKTYLICDVANGKVKDRKILVEARDNYEFLRGDLRGFELRDIILGQINKHNYKLYIDQYLRQMLNFLLNNSSFINSLWNQGNRNSYAFPCDVNENEIIELINDENKIEFMLSNNTIIVDCKRNPKMSIDISNLLERILSHSFLSMRIINKELESNLSINPDILFFNPQIELLENNIIYNFNFNWKLLSLSA